MKEVYLSGLANPSPPPPADLLLVVSPAVPPCCFAQLLAVCELRGFRLLGVQRLQLQSSGAAALGLSSLQVELDTFRL